MIPVLLRTTLIARLIVATQAKQSGERRRKGLETKNNTDYLLSKRKRGKKGKKGERLAVT